MPLCVAGEHPVEGFAQGHGVGAGARESEPYPVAPSSIGVLIFGLCSAFAAPVASR
jgi:hypothetical protein